MVVRGQRRIQLGIEGVFAGPLWDTAEDRAAVIAGVGTHIATDVTDLVGQGRDQEDGTILQVGIEVVVRTHAMSQQGLASRSRDLLRKALDRSGLRPGHLRGGLQVEVVIQVPPDLIEDRLHHDLCPISEGDRELPFQRRIDCRLAEALTDLVTGDADGAPGDLVPDHEVTPLVAQ